MMRLVLAAALGLSITAQAAAAAQPASQDSCFLTHDLRGHTVGTDGHTLYFNVNGVDTYQVTTSDPCAAHATGSDPVILKDRGLGKICHPLDLELTVRGNHCIIEKLTKLTPAEASALPKRLQP
jgi:hypothetical protein